MSKKKLLLSYLYIIFTIVVIGLILSRSIEIGQLRELLSSMNYLWLLGGIGCILMLWLTDATIIFQIIPFIAREKRSFASCFKYGIVGLYYGALTPFASGGEPVQIAYMKRDGIPVGTSTAVVSVKLFTKLLAMCFTFIFYMSIRGTMFYAEYKAIFWIAILGFIVNLIGVVGILIIMTNEAGAVLICRWIIKGLRKIRLVRSEERAFSRIEKYIMDFAEASSYIFQHKWETFVSFVLSIIKMMFMFSIPYMIFRAFNLVGFGFFDLAALNTFMFLTVSFMPTPGTSFAAEGGFTLVYQPVFGAMTAMAIGIWRILTYYMILIFGALLVIVEQSVRIRRQSKAARQEKPIEKVHVDQ